MPEPGAARTGTGGRFGARRGPSAGSHEDRFRRRFGTGTGACRGRGHRLRLHLFEILVDQVLRLAAGEPEALAQVAHRVPLVVGHFLAVEAEARHLQNPPEFIHRTAGTGWRTGRDTDGADASRTGSGGGGGASRRGQPPSVPIPIGSPPRSQPAEAEPLRPPEASSSLSSLRRLSAIAKVSSFLNSSSARPMTSRAAPVDCARAPRDRAASCALRRETAAPHPAPRAAFARSGCSAGSSAAAFSATRRGAGGSCPRSAPCSDSRRSRGRAARRDSSEL